MPDLGLNNVGDEQLLELLNECVVEILSRDPVMARAAQATVVSIDEKRKLFMGEVHSVIGDAKRQYLDKFRQIVRTEIVEAIQSGEISVPSMVNSSTQAAEVVKETKKAIESLKQQVESTPDDATSFKIEFNQNGMKYSYVDGTGRAWDGNRGIVSVNFAGEVKNAIIGLAKLRS